MMMTLKCIKCGIEKELDFFMKDKFKKLGYRPICKDCRNSYSNIQLTTPKVNLSKGTKCQI